MYLFEMSDIKERILYLTSKDEYSLEEMKGVLSDFCDKIGNDMKKKVGDMMSEQTGLGDNGDEFWNYLNEMFESELPDELKRETVSPIVYEIAECSDMEDFCDGKIYIVIHGMDITKEYDSWEDAIKDIDEWYIGCCDDAYIAENVLFQILCYAQEHECDRCINYCSVLEFDATDIEDGREDWENENCEFD